MSDLLLWKASAVRKLTFRDIISSDTISRDTGINVKDLPVAMANKTVWCHIVRDISATAAR